MISEHAITAYFAQAKHHGWSQLTHGSVHAGWHARYEGRYRDYDAYLSVDGEWVYLQCPILATTIRDECKQALFEFLLRANDQIYLAKFVLLDDSSGDQQRVSLTSEVPVDGFGSNMFRLMTQAVATYAEQYDREIQVIALDPELAESSLTAL